MDRNNLDFLDKPAEKEYFTKFLKINGRNGDGVAMSVIFGEVETNGTLLYCDKVRVGETLEEALKRSLKDDFGLELLTYDINLGEVDTAKNKQDEVLNRIPVEVFVKYKPLKCDEVVGLKTQWIERIKSNRNQFYPEALGWLNSRNSDAPLASNRFDKKEAIDFVNKLYNLGAVDITVDLNDEHQEPFSSKYDDYADSLYVKLPKDDGQRKMIFEMVNKEQEREFPGEKAEIDEGQKEITLWWD